MKNFNPFPEFMLKRTLLIAFFAILSLFFTIVAGFGQTLEEAVISINDHGLIVEVADTPAKRETGLMGRETFGWNRGMLFVYPGMRHLRFWMKNTKIPLSLAYIDKDYKIAEILELEPFDLSKKISKEEARFALEVNKDWFRRNNIKVGDVVEGIAEIPKARPGHNLPR